MGCTACTEPQCLYKGAFYLYIFYMYKRDEVTGNWRKLHNEELNNLYSSPNIVWVIKSRIRWAGHVAHMGGGEWCVQGFGGGT
jgi:hypothetical protein